MKKIAFWLGYTGPVSYYRDGIGRMLYFLVDSLLGYTDIKIDIWTPSYNIIPTRQYFSTYNVEFYTDTGAWDTNLKNLNDLIKYFNKINNADITCIPICNMESGLYITGKKWILGHDLMSLSLGTKEAILDKKIIDEYISQDCLFTCNSEYIRQEHWLKLTNIKKNRIKVVKIPALKHDCIEKATDLPVPYFIYPTRIRKYKGIEIVLKALQKVDCNFIFTSDIPIEYNDLYYRAKGKVYIARNVNAMELNYLYASSVGSISASEIEGAIPAPLYEGILNGTVCIARNADYITRGIEEYSGIDPYKSGILFFKDAEELADRMNTVLKDRENILENQKKLKNKLGEYTWEKGIKNYVSTIS